MMAACGDPLTDGDWLGTPELIVRGTTASLPSEVEASLELVIVWSTVDRPDTFPTTFADVGSDSDFGAFELALYDAPPGVAADTIGVGLLTVLAVPPSGLAATLDSTALGEHARGVSSEHYVLFVPDASRWQGDPDGPVLNPIALVDGYNLAVGVCRPGRPSQLLVVPPERVQLVRVDEAEPGQCLDVFWGAWRELED